MGRERAIIEAVAAACWRPDSVLAGIGDDAAVLRPGRGSRLLVTTDALVDGVHFRLAAEGSKRGHSPMDAGWRAAAANLSDIAAMGGEPRWAFLAMAVPATMATETAQAVAQAVAATLERHGCALAGGDTVASPGPFMVALTVVGEIQGERWLSRSGARPGDLVLSSGPLGESAAGLHLMFHRRAARHLPGPVVKRLIQRHLRPEPRLALGRLLAQRGLATACIDSSDGPATDLAHLAHASGVKIVLDGPEPPMSRALKRAGRAVGEDPLGWWLSGGEDFELLWTMPPAEMERAVEACLEAVGRRPLIIGRVEAGSGVVLRRWGGAVDVAFSGYEH